MRSEYYNNSNNTQLNELINQKYNFNSNYEDSVGSDNYCERDISCLIISV